jgi:hypothetical protein
MTRTQLSALRQLCGQDVDVALADGSRIDQATLVSTGGHRASTLWLQAGDDDLFVAIDQVQAVAHARVAVAAAPGR